jgi:hypothetical protein
MGYNTTAAYDPSVSASRHYRTSCESAELTPPHLNGEEYPL